MVAPGYEGGEANGEPMESTPDVRALDVEIETIAARNAAFKKLVKDKQPLVVDPVTTKTWSFGTFTASDGGEGPAPEPRTTAAQVEVSQISKIKAHPLFAKTLASPKTKNWGVSMTDGFIQCVVNNGCLETARFQSLEKDSTSRIPNTERDELERLAGDAGGRRILAIMLHVAHIGFYPNRAPKKGGGPRNPRKC